MNICIFSGHLPRDLDLRVTPNGKSVGSFSLPVKQGYGQYEKVSWVDCKLLGDRADKLAPYLLKGKPVTVQGEFGANTSPDRRGDQPEAVHRSATPPIDDFDDDIPFN